MKVTVTKLSKKRARKTGKMPVTILEILPVKKTKVPVTIYPENLKKLAKSSENTF